MRHYEKSDMINYNFLWGENADSQKWARVRWEKVCTNKKKHGGLGVADLVARNKAMSAEWVWKYATEVRTQGALEETHHAQIWSEPTAMEKMHDTQQEYGDV